MKCELCRVPSKTPICSRCRALTTSPHVDARSRQKRLFLMTLAGNAMLAAGIAVAAVVSGSMAHRAPPVRPAAVTAPAIAAATPVATATATATPAAVAKAAPKAKKTAPAKTIAKR